MLTFFAIWIKLQNVALIASQKHKLSSCGRVGHPTSLWPSCMFVPKINHSNMKWSYTGSIHFLHTHIYIVTEYIDTLANYIYDSISEQEGRRGLSNIYVCIYIGCYENPCHQPCLENTSPAVPLLRKYML